MESRNRTCMRVNLGCYVIIRRHWLDGAILTACVYTSARVETKHCFDFGGVFFFSVSIVKERYHLTFWYKKKIIICIVNIYVRVVLFWTKAAGVRVQYH